MFEPTKKERTAWQRGSQMREFTTVWFLADAYLRCLAAVMEAEFYKDHLTMNDLSYCHCCGFIEKPPKPLHPRVDHRHLYDSARWLEAARKRLEEP